MAGALSAGYEFGVMTDEALGGGDSIEISGLIGWLDSLNFGWLDSLNFCLDIP